MTLLKAFIFTTIFSATSIAAHTECPTGWLPNTWHETKCCSGDMEIDGTDAYCCVSDMRYYKEMLTNTALLYGTATTTADDGFNTMSPPTSSCVAKVPFTASDYSAQVSSASTKAEATPTDSSATTTKSATNSGTGSKTSTSAPTSTANAAMPFIPADDLALGGAAFAAALFML